MTEPTPHDDALAQRIRSGDREALGVLYDRYASLALAAALRVVADREVAEDLVHDAFVAVWRKIDKFDPGRGSLRSWLLTVVRNRAIDRVRGARQTIEVGEADAQSLLRSGPNPTWEAAVQQLSVADLRGAIDALPGEQRQAIELAYFGGLSQSEIAARLQNPLGTVKTRIRLGLQKLRDILTAQGLQPLGLDE